MASPGEWLAPWVMRGVGAAKYRPSGVAGILPMVDCSQPFLRMASAFLSILPSSAFDIRPALAA
jgi:hypothetical protein